MNIGAAIQLNNVSNAVKMGVAQQFCGPEKNGVPRNRGKFAPYQKLKGPVKHREKLGANNLPLFWNNDEKGRPKGQICPLAKKRSSMLYLVQKVPRYHTYCNLQMRYLGTTLLTYLR
jgi:hypothetical protein